MKLDPHGPLECARARPARLVMAGVAAIVLAFTGCGGLSGDGVSDAGDATDAGGDADTGGRTVSGGRMPTGGGGVDSGTGGETAGGLDAGLDAGPMSGADGGAGGADAGPVDMSCDDHDGDGYGVGPGCIEEDCDDANPLRHPGRPELADDGFDEDCSGADLSAAVGPGLYLDAADGDCSDVAGDAGSKATPFCTLPAAIAAAKAVAGALPVFVAQGSYGPAIEVDFDLSLNGGYDAATWTWTPDMPSHVGGDVNADVETVDHEQVGTWLHIKGDAHAALHGLRIAGGSMTTPQSGVVIESTGRVVLADVEVIAPVGTNTIGVHVRADAKVWILRSLVQGGGLGGQPHASGWSAGLRNEGNATVYASRLLAGASAYDSSLNGQLDEVLSARAVSNHGKLYLVSSLLNGSTRLEEVGGNGNHAYGLYNGSAGTVSAVGNAIFGGRALYRTTGVRNNGGDATLINNVISGLGPTPRKTSQLSGTATTLRTYFPGSANASPGTMQLFHNVLVNLISDFNPAHIYNVYQVVWPGTGNETDDISVINACAWEGCARAVGNLDVDPMFVDAALGDFHLQVLSPCRAAGTAPSSGYAGLFEDRDIDGELRPAGSWDIGVDEVPE